jgi:hypothetical protein
LPILKYQTADATASKPNTHISAKLYSVTALNKNEPYESPSTSKDSVLNNRILLGFSSIVNGGIVFAAMCLFKQAAKEGKKWLCSGTAHKKAPPAIRKGLLITPNCKLLFHPPNFNVAIVSA